LFILLYIHDEHNIFIITRCVHNPPTRLREQWVCVCVCVMKGEGVCVFVRCVMFVVHIIMCMRRITTRPGLFTGVYKFMFAYVYNIMYATASVVVRYILVGTHLCVYAPTRTSAQLIRRRAYCLQSDRFNLCVQRTTVYDDDSSYVIIIIS